MNIQIKEKSKDESDGFAVELIFNNEVSFEAIIPNLHNTKVEENLEWYFEEYVNEPYTAETRVERERTRIKSYGLELFKHLFADSDAAYRYRKAVDEEYFENITFEIVSLDQNIDFQSILWESLRDPNHEEEPLIAKGVLFYRKSLKSANIEARVGKHAMINLLIVTARPNEAFDVNHRTIQRPLIEIINNTGVKVNPVILRPGTYEALREHLKNVKGGYYHIIHFDLHGEVTTYKELSRERKKGNLRFSFNTFGKKPQSFQVRYGRNDIKPFEGKKAFLFFETEEQGVAEPTTAEEISKLIKDYRIPVCILNACQSAKQEGDSRETSIAKTLQENGVHLVLAMRYSVSVTAAEMMMRAFYTQLFKNIPIGEAISRGRRILHDNKNRNASLGYEIELEDWLLPVIYQRKEVIFEIRDRTAEEENLYYNQKDKLPAPQLMEYQFTGRDLDILKIEKLLLPPNPKKPNSNHLLLRGMLGVGKSTLLRHLAKWWVDTKFKEVNNCIYFDAEKETITLPSIVDKIIENLNIESQKLFRIELNWPAKRGKLLDLLKTESYAIIIDNIFEFKDEEAIRFLGELSGASFAVYGSVNEEANLRPHTFVNNVYQLDGLDKDATYSLASAIISEKAKKDMQELVNGDYKFEFEQLLKLLAGFPSAMQIVLPFLNTMTPQEVLEGFQQGTLPIEYE